MKSKAFLQRQILGLSKGLLIGIAFVACGTVRAQTNFTSIDLGFNTRVLGTNDAGQLVGTYQDFSSPYNLHGFFTANGQLTTISFPNIYPYGITPTAINNSGQIVGYYLGSGALNHGFILSNGQFVTYDFPGATNTFPASINSSGQIVGYYQVCANNSPVGPCDDHAFEDGNTIDLFGPGLTFPTAINDSGQVVGQYAVNTGGSQYVSHGFLFSAGAVTTLDDPNGNTRPIAINNVGQIVGTRGSPSVGSTGAFLFENGQFTDFTVPPSFTPYYGGTEVTGIDNAGRVVGWYYDVTLHTHGFSAIFATQLAAPTNLKATQPPGVSGDKIQLKWNYPSGTTIDGFEIERVLPSSFGSLSNQLLNPGSVLTVQPSSSICSSSLCSFLDNSFVTTDGSSFLPYSTYSYRVRAIRGATESDPSNVATSYQLKELVLAGGVAIQALFTPDPTLPTTQASANALGFDHFNWVSIINHDPQCYINNTATGQLHGYNTSILGPPFPAFGATAFAPHFDPPLGGYVEYGLYPGNDGPSDGLPFYWNEQQPWYLDPFYSLNPGYDLAGASAGGPQGLFPTVQFFDAPQMPCLPGDMPTQSSEYWGFFTTLVGVSSVLGGQATSSPPWYLANYMPLASFAWNTTFNGTDGGIKTWNINPTTNSGSGGIFNVTVLDASAIPLAVRQLLTQSGAQGVTNAPKVDQDAPITAAFVSGRQGMNNWYTGAVNIALIATDIDGPSDVAATTYSVDGGASITYSGAFTVSANGTHTIQFGSVDQAGNVETSKTIAIQLGTLPAITSANSAAFAFGSPGSFTVAATGFPTPTLSATGVPSGVTFADNGNGTATLIETTAAAGTYLITISASNVVGSPATQSFTLTVNRANQTITFSGVPASASFGQGPFNLIASATSGLPVSLVATGNCSLSANSLSLTGIGSCSVTATQAGNGNYNAAPTLSPIIAIGQATTATTVTVSPGTVKYSDYTTLAATVSPASAGGQALTGTVQFFLNGNAMGSPALINSSGGATLSQLQVNLSAASYPVRAVFSSTNQNFAGSTGALTENVTQENAFILYSGDTIAQVGTSLNLRATVWDSAATGYPGVNPESGPTATIGDITKIWIAFDIYPAGSCGSGTPSTLYAQATLTGTPGIGTATTTLTSSSEVSYCVVSRLVAGNTGGTNLFYTAPNAETAGLDFYVNSGQFATGGGWVNDPTDSHGNFGFNARYSSTGSPKGQMVYVFRSSYNGVLADFIIKSNALSSLQFSGTTYPISSTLQGKANVQVNRASDGLSLFSAGNYTFSATVTDSGQNGATGKQFSLTVYASNGVPYHQVASNTPLQGGNVVVHSQ